MLSAFLRLYPRVAPAPLSLPAFHQSHILLMLWALARLGLFSVGASRVLVDDFRNMCMCFSWYFTVSFSGFFFRHQIEFKRNLFESCLSHTLAHTYFHIILWHMAKKTEIS